MPTDGDWPPPIVFLDGPDGTGSEDILDIGRDRRSYPLLERWAERAAQVPRLLRWGVAAALVLVAAAGYLVLWPTPGRLAELAGSTAASTQHFANDEAIDMVAATARDSRPLSDYIRSSSAPGACAQVPLRDRPQQDLLRAVHEALPGYTLRDTARTLDQFTALCTLELRATDAHGSTLVVTVASPARADRNPFDQVTVASRSDGTAVISIVSNTTRAGWVVTVGAIGPVVDQPSSAAMLQLAQDPMLLW